MPDAHAKHAAEGNTTPSWVWPVAIGGAAITGALLLAPTLLPMVGIGSHELALETTAAMHVSGDSAGSGLAGGINSILNAVPIIGPRLAEGGLFAAAVSVATGLGGLAFGNYLEKKEGGKSSFSIGKLIKYAALATSALISLPSLITGISMGIVYLSGAFGDNETASKAASQLYDSLGSSHKAGGAVAAVGLVSGLSHLATCGAPLVPAIINFTDNSNKQKEPATKPAELPAFTPPDPLDNSNYTDGSITAHIKPDTTPHMGKRTTATLTLTNTRTGAPVSIEELAVVHTKPLHMFVVDEGLRDYQHIHPEPTGKAGEYRFSFIPQTTNNYSAWADITVASTNRQHRLKSDITCSLDRPTRAHITRSNAAISEGLRFQLKTPEPLRKDTPSSIEIEVTDMSGNPVTDLQPVLGARAHLVAFSADGRSMLHAHPHDAAAEGSLGGPTLRFELQPDHAAPLKLYLRVRRNGQDITVPFGQQVYPALAIRQPRGGHSGHSL